MTSFFGGMWSGMSTVNELEHGVFERFLATPLGSSALVVSQVVRAGLTGAIEGLIILVVEWFSRWNDQVSDAFAASNRCYRDHPCPMQWLDGAFLYWVAGTEMVTARRG